MRGNPRTRRSGIPAAIAVRRVGAGLPVRQGAGQADSKVHGQK